MNETIDLDALLKGWPAPVLGAPALGAYGAPGEGDEAGDGWDRQADAIVAAALAADPPAAASDLASLLDPPALRAESGEPVERAGDGSVALFRASAGENIMSQDADDSGGPSKSEPVLPLVGSSESAPPVVASLEPAPASVVSSQAGPPSVVPPPTERKRPSLRAMAERASLAGAARASTPSLTPVPSSTVTPLPKTASFRPPEASKDDSGIVHLDTIREAATAQQIAAAETAKPATEGLFDEEDEKPKSKLASPAAKAAIVVPSPKKGKGGVVAGAVIALFGIAAAFAIFRGGQPPPSPPLPVVETKPAAAPVAQPPPAVVAPTSTVAVAPPPTPSVARPAVASADKPAEGSRVAAVSPVGPGSVPAPPSADAKPASGGPIAVAPIPPATGKAGDLASEMAKAVGGDGQGKAPVTGTPEPVAGGTRNQDVPEQPSQGSVQATIGGVMAGAKACVSGSWDVSRAQITFASNGSVNNVSVTGWAAANGATACIKAALKGAKVGPFSKPSYTVGVTIRP